MTWIHKIKQKEILNMMYTHFNGYYEVNWDTERDKN